MKRLYRSKTNKVIAGIFGGIAETYSIDPSLLRLALVFLGVTTGVVPLVVTYIIGWIIISKVPEEENKAAENKASEIKTEEPDSAKQ